MSDSSDDRREDTGDSSNSPGSSGQAGRQATIADENSEVNVSLEQWKHYEQTARDVSNRRLKTNRLYQGLVSVTIAGVGAGARLSPIGPFLYLIVGTIGVVFSFLWMLHVVSFQQLNSGKYQILQEIETELPHQPFTDEWELLDRGRDPTTYITHTSVEIWWPRAALWVFGGMALYGGIVKLQQGEWAIEMLAIWTLFMLGYWMAAFRGWKPFQIIGKYWRQRKRDVED